MKRAIVERAMDQGNGILRMAPNWVPRTFCVPGRRLKLDPADYYALGSERGGIDERWFSSTTFADNGPGTPEDEGLSYIVFEDGGAIESVTFVEAVAELGSEMIGSRLWDKYGGWPVYAKFFDNKGPLPFHIHQREEHAALVGKKSKPEAYYFPPQMNNYGADFPYTFFGFQPGVTQEQLLECLRNFRKGDNRITDLSAAYRLKPGTGWDIPAGILHAPGTFCTYEPQWASDIFSMFQSVTGDTVIEEALLWKSSPEEKIGDYEWLLELVDWEANADPNFVANHFMEPVPVRPAAEMEEEGYFEKWICYRSPSFSAKELTVFPGQTVTIKDAAAYGLILVQGHGALGTWDIETPTMIGFGQLTYDEFFVTETAAREGVVISNPSKSEPIVMLKNFGPGNPEMEANY